jgi:hypothetical protein
MRLNFRLRLGLIGGEKCDDNQDPRLPTKIGFCSQFFFGKPLSVRFWTAISYPIYSFNSAPKSNRKRKEERKQDVGFDSHQYVHEIQISHLLPFYKKSGGPEESIGTMRMGLVVTLLHILVLRRWACLPIHLISILLRMHGVFLNRDIEDQSGRGKEFLTLRRS